MRDERSLGFIKMTFCNNIATKNRLWAYENKILTEKAKSGARYRIVLSAFTGDSNFSLLLKTTICALDRKTEKYYYDQDLTGPLGIVIGNEGSGMSDKVRKNCDFLVKIPMKGKVTSLNASVSTGIVIYEAVEQKLRKSID